MSILRCSQWGYPHAYHSSQHRGEGPEPGRARTRSPDSTRNDLNTSEVLSPRAMSSYSHRTIKLRWVKRYQCLGPFPCVSAFVGDLRGATLPYALVSSQCHEEVLSATWTKWVVGDVEVAEGGVELDGFAQKKCAACGQLGIGNVDSLQTCSSNNDHGTPDPSADTMILRSLRMKNSIKAMVPSNPNVFL